MRKVLLEIQDISNLASRASVIIFGIGALLLLGATPLAAQQSFFGYTPRVGSWWEYEMTTNGEKAAMRQACVGEEVIEGKTYYWQEIKTSTGEGPTIIKMLVSLEGEVKRHVVKSPGQPAMEMPPQMIQKQRAAGEEVKLEDVGEETVKVPAGSFKCTHYREFDPWAKESMDGWVNAKIGVVKITSKGSVMVLKAYGTGAKSEITETPQKMPSIPKFEF